MDAQIQVQATAAMYFMTDFIVLLSLLRRLHNTQAMPMK